MPQGNVCTRRRRRRLKSVFASSTRLKSFQEKEEVAVTWTRYCLAMWTKRQNSGWCNRRCFFHHIRESVSDSVWYCEQYRKIQSKSLRSFVASEFFGFRFTVSFVITLLSQSWEEGRRRKEEGAEAERRRKEWKRQHRRRDHYLVIDVYLPSIRIHSSSSRRVSAAIFCSSR